jgi:general stress protein 26
MSLLTSLLDKLSAAEAVWFASVRPDGRPHLAPIWHVWLQSAAWVVTQEGTIRAQNVARNSAVCLSLPDPMNALILEGTAALVPGEQEEVRQAFLTKYNWDFATDPGYGHILCISPTKLMAWGDHGEGRWRFDVESRSWESLRA